MTLFEESQTSHLNSLSGYEKTISHPALMFNSQQVVVSDVSHLKWNFEEFNVSYSVYQDQFRVWKYYLSKLLDDKPLKPCLTVEIP
jgi:hypothetical protein